MGEFVGLDDENVAKYWFWPAPFVLAHVKTGLISRFYKRTRFESSLGEGKSLEVERKGGLALFHMMHGYEGDTEKGKCCQSGCYSNAMVRMGGV